MNRCEHCGEFNATNQVGKWWLCDDHKELKQYQPKVKKKYQLKNTGIKPKKGYKIPKISKSHKKKIDAYSHVANKYKNDNPFCEAKLEGCTFTTNDIHHKMGKVGYADQDSLSKNITLLVDTRHFLPVCRSCHNYIEDHPEWSYKKGFSKRRLTHGKSNFRK